MNCNRYKCILLIFMSVLCVSVPTYAKKVKLGEFFVYEGEYEKKGIGAIGEGTLTMNSPKASGFERFLAESNSQSSPYNRQPVRGGQQQNANQSLSGRPLNAVIQDILHGHFDGSHVTNAHLTFSFGGVFDGALEYEFTKLEDQTEQMVYNFKEGVLTIGKIVVKIDGNNPLSFTRSINKTTVTTESSNIDRIKELDKFTEFGPFFIHSLIAGCQEVHPSIFVGKNSIDSLQKLPPHKAKESISIVQKGDTRIVDSNGKPIKFVESNGVFTIEKVDKGTVTFSNIRLLTADLTFDDADFVYKDSAAVINYKDSKTVYKGKLWSETFSVDGYTPHLKGLGSLLRAFFGNNFKSTKLEKYEGQTEDEKGNVIDRFAYGHNIKDVEKFNFIGTWSLKVGSRFTTKNPSKDEGTIEIRQNGTYTHTINERWYGVYTMFATVKREGSWYVKGNTLVLKANDIKCSQKVYPGTSRYPLSMSEINELDNVKQEEAAAITDSLIKAELGGRVFNISNMRSNDEVFLEMGDIQYQFTRKAEKEKQHVDPSQIVGRYVLMGEDVVVDFLSDGTLHQYISETTYGRNSLWKELYQVDMTGRWQILDSNELFVVMDNKDCGVTAHIQSPSPRASKAEMDSRLKYMRDVAREKQAEKRANSRPRSSFFEITEVGDNGFRCEDRDRVYTYIKYQQ